MSILPNESKFMDLVLMNGDNFIGLYYSSNRENAQSPNLDKWHWLKCSALGEAINQDKISVNGQTWWTERDWAISNIPLGYGEVNPVEPISVRSWGYKPSFLFDSGYEVGGANVSLNKAKENIREWVNAGVNYVTFGINWDDVFLSLEEQNKNEDASWARYDELANFVKSLNSTVKIAIRVSVFKRGRTHNDMQGDYNKNNNLWALSESQYDSTGSVNRGIYDRNSFSYSDENAIAQAIDFVHKVAERYSKIMGANRLRWISVAVTGEEEAGFNFRNSLPGIWDLYSAIFDYSEKSKAKFRDFCKNNYPNIQSLNTSWGSNYSDFSKIEPPYPTGSSDMELSLTYSGNKGNDWWYFGEKVMADFNLACKKVVNLFCKYTIEFGSCTDELSVRRGSINVKGANKYSDVLKAQFENIASKPHTSISVDVIRSNYEGEKGTELNTADYSQFPTEPSVYSFIYNTGVSAIQNNATDIMFISSMNNSQQEEPFYQTINAFKNLKIYAENNDTRVVPTKTINYSIRQLLNDPLFLIRKFQENGGFSTRLNLKITENEEEVIIPPVIPPIDNGGIKKSEFSFTQESNGNPIPTDGGGQVSGYVLFAAASHGIVFQVPDPVGDKKGIQCKLEYVIKNSAGKVIFSLKDNYGGFHPNYKNDNTAESYRRVWTPTHPDYENLKFIRDFFNIFEEIPNSPFRTAEDRGNNHASPYYKYIPAGIYTLEIKNTGSFPFHLRAGRHDIFDRKPESGTPSEKNIHTSIPPDNKVYTFYLHVLSDGSGHGYKMNLFAN